MNSNRQSRDAVRSNPTVRLSNLETSRPVSFLAGWLSRMSKALPKGGSACARVQLVRRGLGGPSRQAEATHYVSDTAAISDTPKQIGYGVSTSVTCRGNTARRFAEEHRMWANEKLVRTGRALKNAPRKSVDRDQPSRRIS